MVGRCFELSLWSSSGNSTLYVSVCGSTNSGGVRFCLGTLRLDSFGSWGSPEFRGLVGMSGTFLSSLLVGHASGLPIVVGLTFVFGVPELS